MNYKNFFTEPDVAIEKYQISGNSLIAEKILYNRKLTDVDVNKSQDLIYIHRIQNYYKLYHSMFQLQDP